MKSGQLLPAIDLAPPISFLVVMHISMELLHAKKQSYRITSLRELASFPI
jgi:hypothetical protein